VPLAAPLRVGVSIFSYDGELTFGVTGDYDTASDIGVLAEGIAAGVAELLPSNGHREDAPDRPATGTASRRATGKSKARRSAPKAKAPTARRAGTTRKAPASKSAPGGTAGKASGSRARKAAKAAASNTAKAAGKAPGGDTT
jgi:diacylglycerol O-acyltransferase